MYLKDGEGKLYDIDSHTPLGKRYDDIDGVILDDEEDWQIVQ